jgi:aspartyl-tRNA(Asn)/glutamyl-tRNA(Gln) amidotransferase subunit A
MRIGWAPLIGNPAVEDDVRATCEKALAALEQAGAVVDALEIDLSSSADVLFTMAPISLYALYGSRLAAEGHRLDPSARLAVEGGERITGLQLQRAQMERTRLFRLVQDNFTRFDVLATPTLAATARSANHGAFEPLSIAGAKPAGPRFSWYPYTHAFNATGHPAISIPAGFGVDGLPVGLQLAGPWAGEARLLRIAGVLEAMHPWRQHRPDLEALLLQAEPAK